MENVLMTGAATGPRPTRRRVPGRARRVASTLVGLALFGVLFVAGGCADEADEDQGTTALWSTLRTSIEERDYDTFLSCFTEENQEKLGTDDAARRRFTFAVDDLVAPELRAAPVDVAPDVTELRIQVLGNALPAAIGMPAEPATGLLVDVQLGDTGWVVADARPAQPFAQPGGDPVERAATRAVLDLATIERLAHVLNASDTTALSRDQHFQLSQWVDAVREAGVPPAMEFALDPSRFDETSGVWTVDVTFPGLAKKLEAPDARLEVVLGPVADARAAREGEPPRWRVVESRLHPR